MKPIQFFFQASAHQGRQQFKCLCKFPASSNATLPWSSPSVHFFSTAAAGEKEAMNIGKFYQDLLYRGRKVTFPSSAPLLTSFSRSPGQLGFNQRAQETPQNVSII
jgi:hypothetical protein